MAKEEMKDVAKVDVQAFKARKLKVINEWTNEAKKRSASDRIQANK